jgi:hypothetical protein
LTAAQRQHIVDAFAAMHALGGGQIQYTQLRPMASRRWYAPGGEQAFLSYMALGNVEGMDCSEFVTLLCNWAGVNDPSGPSFAYDGFGNTDTMYAYLGHALYSTNLGRANPGSLALFGDRATGKTQHVCFVVQKNVSDPSNPLLGSHGGSNGPIYVHLKDMISSGLPFMGIMPTTSL